MKGVLDSLLVIHLRLKRMRDDQEEEEDPELVGAVIHLAATCSEQAAKLLKHTCPGKTWRKKKCTAKDPIFANYQVGPDATTLLCNACWQAYNRDKKNGAV